MRVRMLTSVCACMCVHVGGGPVCVCMPAWVCMGLCVCMGTCVPWEFLITTSCPAVSSNKSLTLAHGPREDFNRLGKVNF